MPTFQSVTPPAHFIYEPPSDWRRFIIRPPEGVAVDSIKAWISSSDGAVELFTSDAPASIYMDFIYAGLGRAYTVVGYRGDTPVAECTGDSMDLDILDVINLLPLVG